MMPIRSFLRGLPGRLVTVALLAAALAACAPRDRHVPDFARASFESFSRGAAVEIALREWRAFGGIVLPADATAATVAPAESAERRQGLWQRVGEYWWLGLNADQTGQAYTGLHDEQGRRFAPERDGAYAWSAAFISYVMRMAGAGPRFPYAASHYVYVNAAFRGSDLLVAEDPALYAPQPGDLVCVARDPARPLRYTDLPAARFWGHCDIVVGDIAVSRGGEGLAVIGGNVQDAVALKHLPLQPDGRLAVAPDRPWLAVLRVRYETL
jgi:hypothetical protein